MFKIDLNETFPHLNRAPIVEAVVHWQARAERAWNPLDLRRLLADQFPDYPEPKSQHEVALEATLDASETATRTQNRWQGFRLVSADERQIVQFTRNGLVFSRLQPYEDWQTFSQEAIRFWTTFAAVSGCSEIQRLGVRYINRISIRRADDAGTVLRELPSCLKLLHLPVDGFFNQITLVVPESPFKMTVTEAIQLPARAAQSDLGLILDIDVFTAGPVPADSDVQQLLTPMRWLKDKAFFSLLTTEAIRSFGVEKPWQPPS
jgi:uncharacterized protein (TIGR04255 family)